MTTPEPTTEPAELAAERRRRFLKAGGLGALATAVAAACSGPKTVTTTPKIKAQQTGNAPISNPDEAPATVPPAVPTKAQQEADLANLRTATSMEYAIVNAYAELQKPAVKAPANFLSIVPTLVAHHNGAILQLQQLTTSYLADAQAGPNKADFAGLKAADVTYEPGKLDDGTGVKDTNGNGWWWTNVIKPGVAAIAVPNDAVVLALHLENTAVATYVVNTGTYTTTDLRHTAMEIGAVEARHTAKLALLEEPPVPGAPYPEFYTRDALGSLALLTFNGKPPAATGGG